MVKQDPVSGEFQKIIEVAEGTELEVSPEEKYRDGKSCGFIAFCVTDYDGDVHDIYYWFKESKSYVFTGINVNDVKWRMSYFDSNPSLTIRKSSVIDCIIEQKSYNITIG